MKFVCRGKFDSGIKMVSSVQHLGNSVKVTCATILLLFLINSPLFAAERAYQHQLHQLQQEYLKEKLTSIREDRKLPATEEVMTVESVALNLTSGVQLINSSAQVSTQIRSVSHPEGSNLRLNHDKRLVLQTVFHSSASDREQADQKRGQSGALSEISAIEEPAYGKREPKWWDACNKRLSLNDTLINIMIGPQWHHSSQMLEEDRKHSGKYAQHGAAVILTGRNNQPTKSTEDLQHRSKRSTKSAIKDNSIADAGSGGVFYYGNAGYFIEDNKGGLIVDNGKHQYGSKRVLNKGDKYNYGVKKTTFSMFNANKQYPKKQRNHHLMLVQPVDQVDVSKLPISNGNADQSRVNNSKIETASIITKQVEQIVDKIPVIKVILDSISALDIRLSWQINCALNAANSVRRLLVHVLRLLGRFQQQQNLDIREQTQQVIEELKWLPKLDTLIKKNTDATLYESRLVLTNVTHYMQFFNVAFEQMVFEQRSPISGDRRASLISQAYRDLDRAALRMLCDIESLVRLLENLEDNKRQLIEALKVNNVTSEATSGSSLTWLKLSAVDSMERRLRYNKDPIESAYWISSGKPHLSSDAANSTKTSFVLLGRSVMPTNQRNLQNDFERKSRDYYILNNYDKMLAYYESLLTAIYI